MATGTRPAPCTVRGGLAQVLAWLTRHPGIPLSCMTYVDDSCAELDLGLGDGAEQLRAAAITADALIEAVLAVEDDAKKAVAHVRTDGRIVGSRHRVEIIATVTLTGAARAALLTSLPTSPARRWTVTAADLRQVADQLAGA